MQWGGPGEGFFLCSFNLLKSKHTQTCCMDNELNHSGFRLSEKLPHSLRSAWSSKHRCAQVLRALAVDVYECGIHIPDICIILSTIYSSSYHALH